MAAPAKQSSSRWGSFLQQAVAGVESKLDEILAEGDEAAKPTKPVPAAPVAIATKSDGGVSRSGSNSSRPSDRLQERLARAVAAKNKAQRADSLVPSSGSPSRAGSPITNSESLRSTDVVSPNTEECILSTGSPSQSEANLANTKQSIHGNTPSAAIQLSTSSIQETVGSQQWMIGLTEEPEDETAPRFSTESNTSSVPRVSIDSGSQRALGSRSPAEAISTEISIVGLTISKSAAEYDALLSQLQSDLENSELQQQEEIYSYTERIDALQSKLQYLSKESAESARRASNSASAGSLEKKLAEKEEQIALLMEEGQQLSKTELKHLTTIKKLRAKLNEDGKELTDARKRQEKAEKDVVILSERCKRAELSEKRLNEKQKLAAQLQKEIDSLKIERDSKDSTIAELRYQLEQIISREKQAETQVAHESLELERRRVAALQDDLENLKIEKSLVADRAQAQIKDLREKMDMEAERLRIVTLEMKTDQQMLESKLEVMRARAEEVSSGVTGDAQAKLLRQIETLQTQYSVASENWQGIEASLIARVTSLENEREEAARREMDIRRKARELTLKAKRNEDELEDARSKLPTFQQQLSEQRSQLDNLQRRAEEAESTLIESRAAFEREKQSWRSDTQLRIEEESHKMQEEASGHGSIGHSRAESPVTSTHRGLTSEFLGLQNLQIRRASARSVTSDVPTAERILGRRPSQAVHRSSGRATPPRQNSTQSITTNGEAPDTPSIHTIDHDDFFENTTYPSSPQQTINDMVSVSTAGAGPSVQLVERMSSAVRRLESEKVATKEDLARLSAQRDEARAEIVVLMREIEAKRLADSKIAELEEEIKDINSRYQTTLEMLGEKSELVDELRSDIEDIKAMYRELVERTVE